MLKGLFGNIFAKPGHSTARRVKCAAIKEVMSVPMLHITPSNLMLKDQSLRLIVPEQLKCFAITEV